MTYHQQIKTFILNEHLQGEAEENLTDDLELLKNGILDSMAVLNLINYVEEEFDIEVEPEEATETNFETVSSIARFIHLKVAA